MPFEGAAKQAVPTTSKTYFTLRNELTTGGFLMTVAHQHQPAKAAMSTSHASLHAMSAGKNFLTLATPLTSYASIQAMVLLG